MRCDLATPFETSPSTKRSTMNRVPSTVSLHGARRWGPLALLALFAPMVHAAPAAAVVDKGDVAWMMTSTLLVIFMAVPGLALFYGGLVRSKNMLSVLMQVMVVFSLIGVLWAVYGYSLAFGGEGADHRRASTSCS